MADVVVIIGASGGVGRGTARRFALDGARVALLARGRAGLEAAAREVTARGGIALVLPTDVADPDQVEAAAEATEEALGPIDIWINCAMATIYAEFLDLEPEEFRRATDVTYHGLVWGTRAALRRMAPRNRGTIVQVGSALAYRGIPLQAPYCGAKAAAKNVTESVLTEIRHHGWDVHVSMVQLAGFNTTQFTWGRTKLPWQTRPVPPFYQPEVAAEAIHWAAYHRRREVFVGLPTVLNVVGERLAPWLLDWYLARTGVASQLTDKPLEDGAGHDNLSSPWTRTAARTGRSTSRRASAASRPRSPGTEPSPSRSRASEPPSAAGCCSAAARRLAGPRGPCGSRSAGLARGGPRTRRQVDPRTRTGAHANPVGWALTARRRRRTMSGRASVSLLRRPPAEAQAAPDRAVGPGRRRRLPRPRGVPQAGPERARSGPARPGASAQAYRPRPSARSLDPQPRRARGRAPAPAAADGGRPPLVRLAPALTSASRPAVSRRGGSMASRPRLATRGTVDRPAARAGRGRHRGGSLALGRRGERGYLDGGQPREPRLRLELLERLASLGEQRGRLGAASLSG